VIVSTCASIDQDCEIGSDGHIAIGMRLCGGVIVGPCNLGQTPRSSPVSERAAMCQ
jgi:hypothetical protein